MQNLNFYNLDKIEDSYIKQKISKIMSYYIVLEKNSIVKNDSNIVSTLHYLIHYLNCHDHYLKSEFIERSVYFFNKLDAPMYQNQLHTVMFFKLIYSNLIPAYNVKHIFGKIPIYYHTLFNIKSKYKLLHEKEDLNTNVIQLIKNEIGGLPLNMFQNNNLVNLLDTYYSRKNLYVSLWLNYIEDLNTDSIENVLNTVLPKLTLSINDPDSWYLFFSIQDKVINNPEFLHFKNALNSSIIDTLTDSMVDKSSIMSKIHFDLKIHNIEY